MATFLTPAQQVPTASGDKDAAVAVPPLGHAHWAQGVDLLRRGDFQAAARAFAHAVAVAPHDGLYWINLAHAWRHAGELDSAVTAALRCLELQPNEPVALRLLGNLYAAQGRHAAAVSAFETLAGHGVKEPSALLQLGSSLLSLGRALDASRVLMEAMVLDPATSGLDMMLPTAFRETSLCGQDMEALRTAVALDPGNAQYWIMLANAWRQAGELRHAVTAVSRCLELQPDDPAALRLLGDLYTAQHRYADAVAVFETLEGRGVKSCDALLQHGSNLLALRRPLDASRVLMEALAQEPMLPGLHMVLSTAFRDLGLRRQAVECLRTALALDPGNLQALAHLSYEKRHLVDWSDLNADVRAISEALQAAPAGQARLASSFSLLSLPLDPRLHLVAARGEALAAAIDVHELPAMQPADFAGRKVRLGFMSFDFHQHPVSQLMVDVIERIDRNRFEVWLYATGPDDGSELRQRILKAADHWTDLRGISDADAAERLRADAVEVLVDLQGFTLGHRMGILARRPAPVQVGFLGYPASAGAPYIDYVVGDPVVTPMELAPHYSEKLAQMPLTFQPNGRGRPLPSDRLGVTRQDAGLPEDAFVMCAFHNTYKILPHAFDVWCSVMRAVPHAVLWLREANGQLHDNVLREAEARGVDRSRVVFARPNAPFGDYIARLALADVFVDAWPYNAHTTAADALWAGVPVLTVCGNSFASRVATSVLNAAGLAELAFGTPEDYRAALLTLAREPSLLAEYRALLDSRRMELPLFDTPRYTRELEDLFLCMSARWRAGLEPDHLPAATR